MVNLNKFKWVIVILVLGFMFGCREDMRNENSYRLIIPNGIQPNSFDPIHCDQFNNYFPSQMIYSAPLATGSDGKLVSDLLEHFSYDGKNRLIVFHLKNGLKFSDGSDLTANDVAFSIARLLFSRPMFPTFSLIKGKEQWLRLKEPLRSFPDGIQVDGNRIEVRLDKPVLNPLFRFAMTVVSVIPRRCVDPATNKINCSDVPSSGRYVIKDVNENKVKFVKWNNKDNHSPTEPNELEFYYPKISTDVEMSDFLDRLNEHEVVFAYDLDLPVSLHKRLMKDFRVHRLAAAWFSGFVLNPRVEPFTRVEARRFFLNEFQARFSKQQLDPIVPSQSLFPKLVSGYVGSNDFPKQNVDLEKLKGLFRGKRFNWGVKKSVVSDLLKTPLSELAKQLQFELNEPEVAPSSHAGWPSYKGKEVAFQTTHSGFWPLDPVGDIQMLFTPGLHEDYLDIWGDQKFNKLVQALQEPDVAMSAEKTEIAMRAINRKLYDNALMGVFSHQSYSYISRNSGTINTGNNGSPFSLTVPYPWEVF
jgi:hypothetical protein